MSIPLDRLYHYIENIAKEIRGDDVLIYRFFPHGSKNINDLRCTKTHTFENQTYWPHLICYDQEPLNYDFYKNTPVYLGKRFVPPVELANLPKTNLWTIRANIYDKCLLLHSERYSPDVVRYQQDRFVPVYFWSHAIIARDWFRYAPYANFTKTIEKTFLIYNRAWAGTREYRLKFIDLLIENNLLSHCKTSFNPYDEHQHYKNYVFTNPVWAPVHNLDQYLPPTTASSSCSADFEIDDYNHTEFEVVFETLFDDQRQQLTEKIFRPIACKQPFILASTTGSLNYLHSYGFQTFNEIFSEDYDSESDPVKRMKLIVELMQEIAAWTPAYKLEQMKKIKEITEFNHQHFFSDQFFDMVTTELKDNLTKAFDHIENTNIGKAYRDLEIKNIPGIRQWRKNHDIKINRINALKKIKEHRKRNRTKVK
jgi:hypothetical protein